MPRTVRNYQSPYTVNSLKDYMANSNALTLAVCWKLIPTAPVEVEEARTPDKIGVTLRAWFRNDDLDYIGPVFDDGDPMPIFPERTANARTALQSSAGLRPTFSKGTGLITPGYMDITGSFTVTRVYVVCRAPGATFSNYGSPFGNQVDSPTSNRPFIFENGQTYFHSNPYPVAVWRNGQSLSSPFNLAPINEFMILAVDIFNPAVARAWRLGANGTFNPNLEIKEVICVSGTPTTAQHNEIQLYLSQRHGIALHSSVASFRPTVSAIGATTHTRDLTLFGHGSTLFRHRGGVIPTVIDAETGSESSGLEVQGAFDDTAISAFGVARGDWDRAEFEIFIMNYETPAMGELIQFVGTVGEIATMGRRFQAEGRPLSAIAQTRIGYMYTAKCQAKRLGDADCKVNVNAPAAGDSGVITVTGTVTDGGSNEYFGDSARTEVDGYFDNGVVTFGAPINKSVEIRSWTLGDKRAIFQLPMFTVIPVGTTYSMERGCDRSDKTCANIYNNIVNITRSFPKLPGIENALRIIRAAG